MPNNTTIQGESPTRYNVHLETTIDIISIVIAILICFTNILTITAISKFKKLKSATNYLILSLSVADLSFGVTLPLCTGAKLLEITTTTVCRICLGFKGVNLAVSLTTIVAIALERFYAIVYPFQHRVRMSKKPVTIVIIIIWIYNAPLFISNSVTVKEFECHGIYVSPWLSKLMACHIGLYFIICGVVYTKIFFVAKEHSVRVHGPNTTSFKISNDLSSVTTISTFGPENNSRTSFSNISKRNHNDIIVSNGRSNKARIFHKNCQACLNFKLSMMTFLVLLVVVLCWLPFVAMNIVNAAYSNQSSSLRNILYDISLQILFCNSFLNPILYCWGNATFKKGV